MAWVQERPEGAGRDAAAEAAFASWSTSAPESLATWLNEQKNNSLKDIGLSKLAESWASSQPANALQAALSIRDAERARSVVTQVFGDWQSHDPQAAATWLSARPALKPLLLSEP
jgi:hypothetical protein